MRKKIFFNLILVFVFISIAGCTSLTQQQVQKLNELNSKGISSTQKKEKSPIAAAGLNLLPGFGNYYLAYGTNESPQWMYGTVNLLLWPISPIWGVPEAAIDAHTINKKATVSYYVYNPKGKKRLNNIKKNTSKDSKSDKILR